MNSGTAPSANRPSAEAAPRQAARSDATGRLYRVIWRWHFYAGVLVSPVLLAVTITGALYIFRPEVEDCLHARLRFISPGPPRLGPQDLVDAARAAHPALIVASLERPADRERAAVVRMGEAPGEATIAVYVDPYRGHVLGAIGPDDGLSAFFDVVLKLHRELLLGTAGRLAVELTVGWTIVLLATGLYLWWPRHRGRVLGVWWPRWRAKTYTVLRDLHTVLGFYLLAPMLVIAVTGLFYTLVWGEAFHQVTREGGPKATATTERPGAPGGPTLPLDRIEGRALALYPGRNLAITLPRGEGRAIEVAASNDYNKPYGPYVSARIAIDRADGSILSHTTLAEDDRYWWHGWAYPLHVGSVLGPTTKVIWLVACLVLIALPVTGLWMWWERRPSGRTGFPRRPETRLPRGLIALIAALSVALPIVGLSILLILIGEGLVGMVRNRLARPS